MTITNLKHRSNTKFKLSIIITCFFTMFSFSQVSSQKNNFWKDVQFGGGIGLNVGNGFFSGMLAPNALYSFNPYVSAGVGLNFQYSSVSNDFKSTVLGGSVIGLFNPFKEIQISTEFEQLFVNRNFNSSLINTSIKEKYSYPALFLGLGYRNRNVTLGVRYDVLYDKDTSIQPQAWMPFVRFMF